MRNSRHAFSIDTEDRNASAKDVLSTNSRVSKIIISIVLLSLSASSASVKRDRERLKKHVDHVNLATSSDICFVMNNLEDTDVDISKLSQFIASRQKKVVELLEKDVFKLVNLEDVSDDARVFNSRFVDEIKNSEIDKTFEKSRLMIQIYNDLNKNFVLTQFSTIQRVSQRLIICFVATFQNDFTKLYFCDVTQAYVQSNSKLNRDFFIRSLQKLIAMMRISFNCILKVVKSLYDVSKTENH